MKAEDQPDLEARSNHSFSEYVTSTAFRLSLSKPQIECLCQIDQLGGSWMLTTTFNALSGKGLVERTAAAAAPNEFITSNVKLTQAGEAVIPLLKLAGLYRELPKWEPPAPQPEINITIKRRAPLGEVNANAQD